MTKTKNVNNKGVNKDNKKASKSIRDNVETILRQVEETRNDDMRLIYTYWKSVNKIVDADNNIHISNMLLKATPAESITRARRLIQEEGKYMPTDPVVAARRRKEKEMRKNIKKREVN